MKRGFQITMSRLVSLQIHSIVTRNRSCTVVQSKLRNKNYLRLRLMQWHESVKRRRRHKETDEHSPSIVMSHVRISCIYTSIPFVRISGFRVEDGGGMLLRNDSITFNQRTTWRKNTEDNHKI